MAGLSDARIRSIERRGEAVARWSKDELLALPDAIRETMGLLAEDVTALLSERERLLEREGDRGRRNKNREDDQDKSLG